MDKKLKTVGTLISSISAVVLAIVKLAPGNFDNLKFDFLIHVVNTCTPELLLAFFLGICIVIYEMRQTTVKNDDSNFSNFPQRLPSIFSNRFFLSVIVILLIGINGYFFAYLVRARCYFFNHLLYESFKFELDNKICEKVNQGEYEQAEIVYKNFISYFPIQSKNGDPQFHLDELERRISISNEYFSKSKGVVTENKQIDKNKFTYLLRSYSLNPKDESRKRINEVAKIIEDGALAGKEYCDLIHSGDQIKSKELFNQWGWLFFDIEILTEGIPFSEKNSSDAQFKQSQILLAHVTSENFSQRIKRAWMMENCNNILAWKNHVGE